MWKPKEGCHFVESGKIRKGDFLRIFDIWHEASTAVGADIGSEPWHVYGDVCRPLKTKEVSKPSSNTSYTAALREKCKHYFDGASNAKINNFIKSVQRLNASRAKHCA